VPLALLGGAGALALLALQAFAIHAFCRFCLVADASALIAAGTAGGVSFAGPRRPALALSGGLTALALALSAVVLARAPRPPPGLPAPSAASVALPAVVAREQRAGVLTIVEFTDFECPFCRRLHLALEEALRGPAGLGSRVRIVRKMMPLPGLHPHALDAALAWCCADQAGRGDAMANALVHADDLGLEANVKLAAGVAGRLPTYWIGTTMYRGARDAATLRRCIEDEERAARL
jgi:protein-disulfide isomerase